MNVNNESAAYVESIMDDESWSRHAMTLTIDLKVTRSGSRG
jgi:hypothetical protein